MLEGWRLVVVVQLEAGVGFGDRLQREREMRGITLEEIANATKIGTRSLRALEEEDFGKLPGGIFNKGFVRAYARYLGIDEEQAVADYQTALGSSEAKDDLDAERLKKLEESWKPVVSPGPQAETHIRVPWGSLVLGLVLVGGGFLGWRFRHEGLTRIHAWQARRHQQTTRLPTAARPAFASTDLPPAPALPVAQTTPAPVAGPSPAPVSPASSVEPEVVSPSKQNNSPSVPSGSPGPATGHSPPITATAAGGAAEQEFVVQVQAHQDSWVSITADGKPVMQGILIASRKTSVHAKQKITLVAGNAGGIEISFNGKPQPPLGGPKEVRTVTFTPDGLQQ